MRRFLASAFVTPLGRHNPTSLGRDVGVHEFNKNLKNPKVSMGDKLGGASKLFDNIHLVTKAIGALKDAHAGLVRNGEDSATNHPHSELPFVSESTSSTLGRNDARYYKTNVHVGRTTGSRIKKIQSGPHIESVNRLTSSSSTDYLDHKKRSQLSFNTGFNEKTFSFLMEDTYFSIGDYYRLFKIPKNYKKELEKEGEGKKDIYGCVLRTKNKFRIKNRLDYYTCHIKIHLIKITDPEMDVRELIEEITHNNLTRSANSAGKIPKDQQYTNPVLSRQNQLCTSFRTSLNCNLKYSTRFTERARIVKTWTRTLAPGSIWEFNLTHHLGRGLHINRIYDIENRHKKQALNNYAQNILNDVQIAKNQTTVKSILENAETVGSKVSEHPTGYIYCLEYVGDRRASLVNKQGDYFLGYSPCFFNLEFDTSISYVQDSLNEDEILTYRKSRQETEFNEESDFPDIFYPDRQPKFHIPFTELNIAGETKKPYTLTYDQSIKSSTDFSSFLDEFGRKLESYGFKFGELSSEDLSFNFTKDPSMEEDSEEKQGD